jgi:hypothetical protein
MRNVTMLGIAVLISAAACGGKASPSAPQGMPTTSPIVQQVAEAVRLGDVVGLLDLMDWQPTGCGGPTGHTDLCPEGVAQNTELPMVYADFGDGFLVRRETLGPALTQVLQGEPLRMTFLATSPVTDHRGRQIEGPVYFLGMEGASRPVSPSYFWGDAKSRTGVFLELNAGSEHPIVEVGFLGETWTASQQAGGLSIAPSDVLVGPGTAP